MIHLSYRPKPPLDRFIEFVWAADEYVAQTARERVLPNGATALVVVLGERPVHYFTSEDASAPVVTPGAVLCGTRQTPLIIGTAFGPTVGVHFRPGGARPFFDVPARDLTEQALSLEVLWGSQARSLREQLEEAPTQSERILILEQSLLGRLRSSAGPAAVLRTALQCFEDPTLPSVAEVNRRTGLSPKKLLALFDDQIGLTPKAYWRVRRFRAALSGLERGARGVTLAYELGYADQPHYLREFRAMAGSSPREYLAQRVAGNGDHVAVRR
jgi:AraC-like DNA-binding protein